MGQTAVQVTVRIRGPVMEDESWPVLLFLLRHGSAISVACLPRAELDPTHLPLVQVVCRSLPEELLPAVGLGAEGKSGLGQAERVGVELLDGILGFAFPLGLVR